MATTSDTRQVASTSNKNDQSTCDDEIEEFEASFTPVKKLEVSDDEMFCQIIKFVSFLL